MAPFSRRLSRWAWIPFVLFLVGILSSGLFAFSRYDDAALRERAAIATVTAHTNNHNRYRYEFMVRGMKYGAWGGLPDRELRIGERIAVYYDQDHPDTNALEHLSAVAEKRTGRTIGMTVIALLIFLAIWKSQGKLGRPQTPGNAGTGSP